VDCLVRREEVVGHKVMDFFSGRDQGLIYRSVTVDHSEQVRDLVDIR
jgi:hypothetical protein